MSKHVILSIFHHKTGCALNSQIYRSFREFNCIKIISNPVTKRVLQKNSDSIFISSTFDITDKNIIYKQASPNFFEDIFEQMPKINKVVHFRRESYSWAISNYLYHTQQPTPEKWFLNINKDINTWFNVDELKFLSKKINLDYIYIDNLINHIKSIYNCPDNLSYYEYLISLPIEDGIIIETARFLLNNNYCAGCDYFRSYIISKNLEKHKNKVLNLKMSDFQDTNFEKTIKKLYLFIFDNNEVNFKKIFQKLKEVKMLQSKKKMKRTSSSHYTKNLLTKKEREKILEKLKNDKDLSYILEYVNINNI